MLVDIPKCFWGSTDVISAGRKSGYVSNRKGARDVLETIVFEEHSMAAYRLYCLNGDRRISLADRRAGRTSSEALPWKYRDHGHFIGFAPFDEPRYAIGVTLEHGNHGAAAAQVARDIMTYLYAPDRAMTTLAALEAGWGGDIRDRMDAQVARWNASQDSSPPPEAEKPDAEGQAD